MRAERPLFVRQEIDPDVRSNTDGPVGRIYVLLLDDLHTAFQRSNEVRRMARQFIERSVGANDLVAVVHSSGRAEAGQGYRQILEHYFPGSRLRKLY